MARITVEDCLTKETNRFALVLLAAKRTKQILHGSKTLISDAKNKAVVNALREIAAGKVRFMTEEERAQAEEQRRQREEQERQAAGARAESQLAAQQAASALVAPSADAPAFDSAEGGSEDGSGVAESANR
ncbi:MAG: DNA-directed RNA polymerase subunit omega [Proteobacteria bacterium]|nr:DNA-directed RNA polymerase subunit omega [Pseudomonadota bacterium]